MCIYISDRVKHVFYRMYGSTLSSCMNDMCVNRSTDIFMSIYLLSIYL